MIRKAAFILCLVLTKIIFYQLKEEFCKSYLQGQIPALCEESRGCVSVSIPGTMSSLYTRSKEFTRNRKSQSDSPPASPSPTAKTLRVSLFYLCLIIACQRWELYLHVTCRLRLRKRAFQSLEKLIRSEIASKAPASFPKGVVIQGT